ncbi:Hypothetical predicted protein [Olea europaea subsp. europaea]|uniref:Uncharacterized protein n=1 Tax=Olea europaea subsp. europaea TaxID=158383 RepID=A0A8S0UKV4_OLEEU|nr:Hypothetical predicted protein [Olea europaea subsp. europaea]
MTNVVRGKPIAITARSVIAIKCVSGVREHFLPAHASVNKWRRRVGRVDGSGGYMMLVTSVRTAVFRTAFSWCSTCVLKRGMKNVVAKQESSIINFLKKKHRGPLPHRRESNLFSEPLNHPVVTWNRRPGNTRAARALGAPLRPHLGSAHLATGALPWRVVAADYSGRTASTENTDRNGCGRGSTRTARLSPVSCVERMDLFDGLRVFMNFMGRSGANAVDGFRSYIMTSRSGRRFFF